MVKGMGREARVAKVTQTRGGKGGLGNDDGDGWVVADEEAAAGGTGCADGRCCNGNKAARNLNS